MAGSFGYELDLNLLTEEEKRDVKRQIQEYKRYWPLLHSGKYYRLHTPGKDTEAAAWSFVSEDQSRMLLNIVSLDTHGNNPINYVRCKGLDAEKNYCLQDAEGKNGKMVYSGSVLMHVGVPVPSVMGEYKAWQMLFIVV